jgi:hypothetical protein
MLYYRQQERFPKIWHLSWGPQQTDTLAGMFAWWDRQLCLLSSVPVDAIGVQSALECLVLLAPVLKLRG